MKLIFIIGIVIAIIWYVTHEPVKIPTLTGMVNSAYSSSRTAPAAAIPPPAPARGPVVESPPAKTVDEQMRLPAAPVPSPSPASGLKKGQSLSTQIDQPPPVWQSYRFRYRALPPEDSLQRWQSMGVEMVSDPVSRVVTVRGPLASVNGVIQALQAADVSAQDCCVQAWTVYVDRRAQKGFDLAAAIGAVTSTEATVSLDGKGLTLDVGKGRVAAALDIIAGGGAVEVVQNPYVRLLDSQPAKIESIEQVPVPETVVANGVAQTSVKYQKVGLQLSITPSFFDHDVLRLSIDQTNGVVGSTVKVGNNDVAIIQSQTVASVAQMSVGQTLILGGVRTYRKESKRGFLGKSEEVSEGSLYVVLSTYRDAPKAVLVDEPVQEYPASLSPKTVPPFTVPAPAADDWLSGELLPPRMSAAEREEIEFIDQQLRIRGKKAASGK